MKNFILFMGGVFSFAVLFFPEVAQAALQIIPEACYCNGLAPGWGCVGQVAQNLMNVAISIGIAVLTVMLAWAGTIWIMSPFDPKNREKGRTMLANAGLGLFFVLAAWLIIDFLMTAIYNKTWSPWNSILVGGGACLEATLPPTGTQPTVTGGTPATGTGNQQGVLEPWTLAHAAADDYLEGYGIDVLSSGNCSNQNQTNCTSLQGIQAQAIHQIAELKLDCTAKNGGQACVVNVTGGTEVGHETHDQGNRLDICIDSCPNSRVHDYIIHSFKQVNSSTYRDRCGNTYFHEGDHWHVTVNSYCANLPR